MMKNVLFVCSWNRLRSPTAEAVFAGRVGLEVASAGINRGANVELSPELIGGADVICGCQENCISALSPPGVGRRLS